MRLSSLAHARQRRLKQAVGFLCHFGRRPFSFVNAEAIIIWTNRELFTLRVGHVGAMDFQMIAIGIVEIHLRSFCAGASHWTDERHLPPFEVLHPSRQIFGRTIQSQMRMGLIPARLTIILFKQIDFEAGRQPGARLQ
jgi:hypothetical protein